MDDGGCGGWSGSETQESCKAKAGCSWSTSLEYCYGDNYSYFAGTGIGIRSSTDVTISNNEVHHCTGSGIRADTSDNITRSWQWQKHLKKSKFRTPSNFAAFVDPLTAKYIEMFHADFSYLYIYK